MPADDKGKLTFIFNISGLVCSGEGRLTSGACEIAGTIQTLSLFGMSGNLTLSKNGYRIDQIYLSISYPLELIEMDGRLNAAPSY